MRRTLTFLPEVSGDYVAAFRYYDRSSPGRAGPRFEAAFKRALHQIESDWITHVRISDHFHRVSVLGYPYDVYYRLAGDEAIITALLFARFDPKTIQAKLNKRGPRTSRS